MTEASGKRYCPDEQWKKNEEKGKKPEKPLEEHKNQTSLTITFRVNRCLQNHEMEIEDELSSYINDLIKSTQQPP